MAFLSDVRRRRRTFLMMGAALLLVLLCAMAAGATETAHHVDSSAQLKDFLYRVFNFVLLAGLLIWGAKKADIKGILAARRVGVAQSLREAQEVKEAAEKKLAEYNEKLEKASREIDEIYAAIKLEGQAEKDRIIAEAKEASVRIRQQSQVAANQEIQQARIRLQAETARLAVQLAQNTLQASVTKVDQDRFVDEYLKKVVEGQ